MLFQIFLGGLAFGEVDIEKKALNSISHAEITACLEAKGYLKNVGKDSFCGCISDNGFIRAKTDFSVLDEEDFVGSERMSRLLPLSGDEDDEELHAEKQSKNKKSNAGSETEGEFVRLDKGCGSYTDPIYVDILGSWSKHAIFAEIHAMKGSTVCFCNATLTVNDQHSDITVKENSIALISAASTLRSFDVSSAKTSSIDTIHAYNWSYVEGDKNDASITHSYHQSTIVLRNESSIAYLYDYSKAICYAGTVHLYNHSTAVLMNDCVAYVYGCNRLWAHHRSKIEVKDCNCPNVDIYTREDQGITIIKCEPHALSSRIVASIFQNSFMVFLTCALVALLAVRSRFR